MGGYGFELLLIGALVLLTGALSGSEFALISLREGQLRELERQRTSRERAHWSGSPATRTGTSRRHRSASRWAGIWRQLPRRSPSPGH